MSNTTYLFSLADDAGSPAPGATFAQAALVLIATGAAIAGVALAPVDLGDGDYSVIYDPVAHGEALAKFTPTLAGHSFTGRNALARVYMTADSANMAAAQSDAAANAASLATVASDVADVDTTIHAAPVPLSSANVDASFLSAVSGEVTTALAASTEFLAAVATQVAGKFSFDGSGNLKAVAGASTILTSADIAGIAAALAGNVAFLNAVSASDVTALANMVVDASGQTPITYKQEMLLQLAHVTDQYGTALSGGKLVVTYHKQDGSTPIQVATITQDATSGRPVTATTTLSNLP